MSTESQPLGIAILGTGGIAHAHAAAVLDHELARLVAVYGRNGARAAEMASRFQARGTNRLPDVLDDPAVSAVIVATEPQRHGLAIEAARAGKNVLVEKPLAADLQAADAIVAACRETGVVASSVAQRRFSGWIGFVREQLAEGNLGPLHFIDVAVFFSRGADYWDDEHAWRRETCGGLIVNRLIHAIDLVDHVFGPVRRITAQARPGGPGVPGETQAVVCLEVAEPALVTIRASSAFPRSFGERVHICGDGGSIEILGDEVRTSGNPLTTERRLGRRKHLKAALLGPPRPRRFGGGGLADQVDDFVRAVRDGRPPRVSLEDGRRGLALSLAAHRAYQENRTIEVSE